MLDVKKLFKKIVQNMFLNSQITGGYVSDVGTISANSYKDVEITHNFGTTTRVYVVATLFSSGTAVNIGSTTVTVHSVTSTKATVRIFNNRSASISPALEWIAIRK